MSVAACHWAQGEDCEGLIGGSSHAVLGQMAWRCFETVESSAPAFLYDRPVSELAARSGISVSCAKTCLAALIEAGAITVHRRRPGHPTVYALQVGSAPATPSQDLATTWPESGHPPSQDLATTQPESGHPLARIWPPPSQDLATQEDRHQDSKTAKTAAAPAVTWFTFRGELPPPVLDLQPLPKDRMAWQMCRDPQAQLQALIPGMTWQANGGKPDWRATITALGDRGAFRVFVDDLAAWRRENPDQRLTWERGLELAVAAAAKLDQARRSAATASETIETADLAKLELDEARRRRGVANHVGTFEPAQV